MSGEAVSAPWKRELLSYEEVFLSGNIHTPSKVEGQTLLSTELSYRFLGCHLIQRAGRLLKMYSLEAHPSRSHLLSLLTVRPQTGITTGQILLQEFYCQCPLTKYPILVCTHHRLVAY